MPTQISGKELSLALIFSDAYQFFIPPYQRPYAWETRHADVLVTDLIDFFRDPSEGREYFLGSLVLVKNKSVARAEVVDGQQRLTTLTILIATIAHLIKDEGKKRDIQRYLSQDANQVEEIEAEPRLTLRQRDSGFLKKYLQEEEILIEELLNLDVGRLKTEAQGNIQANCRILREKLVQEFGDDESEIFEFFKFIMNNTFVVTVSTPTQASAFRVFTVLNSRGMDLLPTDVLKAEIAKSDESLNEDWEDIEAQVGRDDFAELFSHIRMIFVQKKAQRTMLEEFQDYILTLDEYKDSRVLMDEVLKPYSEAFATIKNCDYEAADEKEINDLLAWLNRLDFFDWVPPTILFFAKYKEQPERISAYLRKIERLSAYLLISQKNINERIAKYSEVIRAIERGDSYESAVALSAEEIEEFRNILDGELYRLTPVRRRYAILRLDSFIQDGGVTYDVRSYTTEHVLPQNPDPESEWVKWWPSEDVRDRWVHRVANLVPLAQRRNSKASNFEFARKKAEYFSGKKQVTTYALTAKVLAEDEWTQEVLSQRQVELMEVYSEAWHLER